MDYLHFDPKTLSTAELADFIRHHDECYDRGEPEIDDPAYDTLVRELALREPESQLLEKIHSMEVSSLGEVVHSEPLLSLGKAYSLGEVLTWAQTHARTPDELLLVEPKYDGISAIFKDGVLATRGDGHTGENITDKIPLIELENADYTGRLDRFARGEILVRRDRFEKLRGTIRSKSNTLYKNSRNILAPLMKLKESRDILAAEYGMKQNHCFLTLVDYDKFSHPVKLSELSDEWPAIVEEFEQLPYPQDGIVVKLADKAYRDSLGNTAHHPRGEIAFKFQNIRRPSRIVNVEWSFGKTALTPVAEIEPVDIGGITITHATLHNLENIRTRDIHIGDYVEVERAGDVIPYIVSSTPGENRRSAVIENCPACGAKLTREGPELVCPNPDCPETLLKNLAAAVKNLGIERLGEPTLRRMGVLFGVKRLSDLFALKKNDFLRMENFQEKSAANLAHELDAVRTVPDYRLLAALNIPHVGLNMAKSILKEMTFAELRSCDMEKLSAIRGVGPERAAALKKELDTQGGELDKLLALLTLTSEKGGQTGRKVCFTGKMPEKRSFYEALAKQNGCTPVADVTGDLAFLVAADPAAAGGKLDKARKMGIPVKPLSEFLAELPQAEPDTLFAPAKQEAETEQLSLF